MFEKNLPFIIQELENLESLIKSEAIDGKVNIDSAKEYVRILPEAMGSLNNISE